MTYGGNLTLASTARTTIDIAGLVPGQFDVMQVSGLATLGGTLGVALGDGFMLEPGQSFTFLTSAGGLTGEFAGLADGSVVSSFDGQPLYVHYLANAVEFQTAAIPEPATYAMMLLGFGAVFLAARRRWRGAS